MTALEQELIDTLGDVVNQACAIQELGGRSRLDSSGLSAYADALLLLERLDRVVVIHKANRRVIAKWIATGKDGTK